MVCRFSLDVTTSVVSVESFMNAKIVIVQSRFNMANARFVIRVSFRSTCSNYSELASTEVHA